MPQEITAQLRTQALGTLPGLTVPCQSQSSSTLPKAHIAISLCSSSVVVGRISSSAEPYPTCCWLLNWANLPTGQWLILTLAHPCPQGSMWCLGLGLSCYPQPPWGVRVGPGCQTPYRPSAQALIMPGKSLEELPASGLAWHPRLWSERDCKKMNKPRSQKIALFVFYCSNPSPTVVSFWCGRERWLYRKEKEGSVVV